MKVISPKLAGIAILGIAMACCTTTVLAANTVATVNTSTSTAVNPHIYGVNNIWYWMPGANFASYYGTLSAAGGPNATGAGMNYMRFPGGFESESYQWFTDTNSSDVTYGWVANTLDSSYSNYYCPSGTTNPCPPGVTPSTIIADMGNNNVSFVVRTADAMQALRHNNNVTTCKAWAAVAAGLVTTYGSSVKDWQIGNEWYNAYGAPQNLADYEAALAWYGTLVGYYAPLMKQVNPNIRIWETFNIALQSGTINGPTFNLNGYSSDLAAMKAAANAVPLPVGMTGTPWGYVDGLDIHPYAGVNPSPSGNWMPPTIAALAGDIHTLQTDPNGKPLIYGSEWMADLSDNNTTGGLQNADYMLQHFGQLAAAGITQAAYWPPVWYPIDKGGKTPAQVDTITLENDTTYVLDADAEAFGWLSSYFTGSAVPVTVTNSPSGVTSIAAKNSLGQIVVFVMSNPLTAAVPPYPATSNETVDVEVKGTSWSTIVSAEALYASGAQSVSVGPVSVNTAITANKVTIGTKSAAEFTLDPGGSGRGSNAEIVKLILQ